MKTIGRAILVIGLFLLSLVCIFFLLGGVLLILQPSDAESLTTGLMFTAFSTAALAICVLVLISILRTENRYLDTDGDGIGGDGLAASEEQKRLIANGFRNLGVFYEPKKNLTRAQAREILDELDKKLR